MKKKVLSLLLATALVLSLGAPALAADGEPVFADAANHWSSEYIGRWAEAGVIGGDEKGNINPDAPITRAEFAQVLVNLLGLTAAAENTFADLTGSEWYAGAVLKCAAAGIMKGDGTNSNAANSITRQEAFVMFSRAMGLGESESPDLSGFVDGGSVEPWAAGYMAALADMGIVGGVSTATPTLNATANIDRASIFALLGKSIESYITEGGAYEATDPNRFVVVKTDAGDVTISGSTAVVVVAAGSDGATVTLDGLTADTVKVDGAATVVLSGETTIGSLELNNEGAQVAEPVDPNAFVPEFAPNNWSEDGETEIPFEEFESVGISLVEPSEYEAFGVDVDTQAFALAFLSGDLDKVVRTWDGFSSVYVDYKMTVPEGTKYAYCTYGYYEDDEAAYADALVELTDEQKAQLEENGRVEFYYDWTDEETGETHTDLGNWVEKVWTEDTDGDGEDDTAFTGSALHVASINEDGDFRTFNFDAAWLANEETGVANMRLAASRTRLNYVFVGEDGEIIDTLSVQVLSRRGVGYDAEFAVVDENHRSVEPLPTEVENGVWTLTDEEGNHLFDENGEPVEYTENAEISGTTLVRLLWIEPVEEPTEGGEEAVEGEVAPVEGEETPAE